MKDKEINPQKEVLRKQFLTKRREIPPVQREQKSYEICKLLLQSEFYNEASAVFAYMPIKGEVSTLELIRAAWQNGKAVYLPKVNGSGMDFYKTDSFSKLEKGAFGIQEPNPLLAERFDYIDSSYGPGDLLMLVPGVVFDRSGGRIGYGAGYYDRYLAAHLSLPFKLIGLAYETQILSRRIPTEKTDIFMHAVVTEHEMLMHGGYL